MTIYVFRIRFPVFLWMLLVGLWVGGGMGPLSSIILITIRPGRLPDANACGGRGDIHVGEERLVLYCRGAGGKFRQEGRGKNGTED